jgi:hypothetical protein
MLGPVDGPSKLRPSPDGSRENNEQREHGRALESAPEIRGEIDGRTDQ